MIAIDTDHGPEMVAQTLGSFLAAESRGRFGASHAELAEILPFAAACAGNASEIVMRFITTSSIRCWSLLSVMTS